MRAETVSKNFALPGFEAKSGGHCESSALLNALDYLGYGATEADIVGGAGGISFLFTKGGFPFIGGRSEELRESFMNAAGIRFGVGYAEGSKSWGTIAELLERGLPVTLRVDLRYLPYRYGGKYGAPYMSFGAHWICLAGIDLAARCAVVTDTEFAGLRRVSLGDLDKARFSNTKAFPPRGEYAWIETRKPEWRLDPDALARRSLRSALANYDRVDSRNESGRALVGLRGLADFPEALASIHTAVNAHALAPAYSYMAESIERNGTGGAAFRRFYRDFLVARSRDCAEPRLSEACGRLVPTVEQAMAAWSELASAFDRAAAAIGAVKGSAKAAAISASEEDSASRARKLYAAESAMRDALAEAIAAI